MSKDSHFTGQQYWGIFLFEKVLPDSSLCQNGKQVEIITKERQLPHSP